MNGLTAIGQSVECSNINGSEPMSFEITTDGRSERYRDLVSQAFIELVGDELQYGSWTVTLRAEPEFLRVVMTGPDETRDEWVFGLSGADGPSEVADQLRRQFRPSRRRPRKRRG